MKQYKDMPELLRGYQFGVVPLCILVEVAGIVLTMFEEEDMAAVSPKFKEAHAAYIKRMRDGSPAALMDVELARELVKLQALKVDQTPFAFMNVMGGDVLLCENEEDLKQIENMNLEWAEAHGGRWPNVTDLPMYWDVCNYVNSNASGWAIFLVCTNNAGGTSFYVPRHLWQAARLEEHLAEHNRAWGLAKPGGENEVIE